ncbi:hypothetical protein MWU58_11965 [Flavobacteriaceae bacterium S0825]|uniref:hypothetical protein n=1 Tax=Gaetbulibacter sp. S0825 TaxID=2720084 RepID=UPI001430D17D|nr:hypothetical protein [Gaetbulibacter sp. S0825]MCK0110014.1 hypothetical protein [Flavobacteriaceae bacterium S0825]NIX65643.1 hypothetical protein [Gaetbulibacter sp. S0825]
MKNNYIASSLIFGAGIGISIGVATNSLAVGLSIGIGTALSFAAAIRNESRKCRRKKTN